MRVDAISVANYGTKMRANKNPQKRIAAETPVQNMPEEVSFKGWRGSAGSIIGSLAGVGLGTILSGGLLAPLLLAGAGAVAGGIAGTKSDEEHGNGENNDNYNGVDDVDPTTYRMSHYD